MTSPRRILAVVLPCVRLEIARDADASLGEGDGAIAIVVARPGGAVKDERSLLGNTRLDEVSPAAYALGVRSGHTIAAARARAATLSVRVVHEGAVSAALARLAEALLSFGATTATSSNDGTSKALARAWSKQDDCVWVDTTGCAHLYGGGEEALARKLLARVRALGHACRVGVADGPRIAAQIAWYSREDVTRAPPGEGARALGPLPVAALPVDGETLRWLTSTGLRKIADVQALPPKGLGVRLGPNAAEVLALLAGDDRAPLTPYVPPQVPEESVDLEYGVTSTDALVFIAKRLSGMLAARLEGRAMGATKLELVLKLDRALVTDGGAPSRTVSVSVPVPLVREDELLAVLRAKLESFVVPAPILGAALRAPELAPRGAQALDLFVPEARAERALPRLVAELAAELGEGAVGRLSLTNRWSPLDRAVLLPYGVRAEKTPRLASLEGASVEPTRILPQRKLLASSPRVTITRRLEAVEWWKKGFARTDYGHAWLEAAGATAWVEIVRTGPDAADPPAVALRGWVD